MKCTRCAIEQKGMLAGQAFTPFVCQKCGKETYHPNTGTPMFCDECSKEYNICEYCGKELYGSKK